MSVLLAFSLYDRKCSTFFRPFFFAHEGEARRALADLCSDPSTMVARYPADFDLVKLGEFDDQTGAYQAHLPEVICNASSAVPQGRPMPLFDRIAESQETV